MQARWSEQQRQKHLRRTIKFYGGLAVLVLITLVTIWFSNLALTERFTQSAREEAEQLLALQTGKLTNELQRISVVPALLSLDPNLISSLENRSFMETTLQLFGFKAEIGTPQIFLLDDSGRTVASIDRSWLGKSYEDAEVFVNAIRSDETIFSVGHEDMGNSRFYYSKKLESAQKDALGVIVVAVGLDEIFDNISTLSGTVLLLDSTGKVLLSTERSFLNRTEEEFISIPGLFARVGRTLTLSGELQDFGTTQSIQGVPIIRTEANIQFQGWKLVHLSSFSEARAKVNQFVALEVMAASLLLALALYFMSRRATRQSVLFKAESEELRRLNDRLSREIAERERVEQDLVAAEEDLAQSEKLATIGTLAAAVSHELNQPLTATKTYLAGARKLLQRNDVATASEVVSHLSDLNDRMAAITRQLKSYARKSSDDLVEIDLRSALTSSLNLMAFQFRQERVTVDIDVPESPVMVLGEMVRLEQVIVNLLRNAVDAMADQPRKRIEVTLKTGQDARLTIRDFGIGIENVDDLFQAFVTTKRIGKGLGLGLAISSGIANDLGGKLMARNAKPKGAIFELQLPALVQPIAHAAE